MFVFGFDGCRMAEIDLDSLAHYGFAIEDLPYPDGGLFVEERDYYAAEALEGCPGVDWGGGVDEVFDCLNVICAEDFWVIEVCDEEGIGRRSWRD